MWGQSPPLDSNIGFNLGLWQLHITLIEIVGVRSNYKEREGTENEKKVMEGAGVEVYYDGDVGSWQGMGCPFGPSGSGGLPHG